MHDALQTLIALTTDSKLATKQRALPMWQHLLDQLVASGRAGIATINQRQFWFAAEKSQTFMVIYPDAIVFNHVQTIEPQKPTT